MMTNHDIAKILYEIALYLDMQEVAFKPRAYEKASQEIENLDTEAAYIYKKGGLKALEEIPSIGKAIAEKIEELVNTGHLKYYEGLKKKIPVDLAGITAIEGVGPKMVKVLWEKLRVRNIKDLEKTARAGKIRKVAHFGKRSEEKILKGVEFLKKAGGRYLLGDILPLVRSIEKRLAKLRGVEQVVVAGSVRRWKETVGDADILVVSQKPKEIMEYFVNLPEVTAVHAHGKTKSSVKLKGGMDVDLRVMPKESFGAALNYFTGSKAHNIHLRKVAVSKKWKLNEYGLYRRTRDKWRMLAGKTEEEIYRGLGLAYIEPEMREDTGEIELARLNFARQNLGGLAKKKKLPKLIGYSDLRGDLQVQTDWTDGTDSIEKMAREARCLGHEYIVITDHTKNLAMTHGSDEKKLLKQMAYIDKLNRRFQASGFRFHVLRGAEVNILKDGTLDIDDKVLAKLDVVGVAVHSHFNLPRRDQTRRIVRAMENPHADILFHPTGRLIQKREAYDADMDEIIKVAKRTGTVLEANAFPIRLDLKDEHIRKAVTAGIKIAISTDAHAVSHLSYLEFGIAQARRGWAKKSDVINTRPLREMLKLLK